MKAFAARPRDAEDIRHLAQVLDLHTVDDILASVRAIFAEEEPPARLSRVSDNEEVQVTADRCQCVAADLAQLASGPLI